MIYKYTSILLILICLNSKSKAYISKDIAATVAAKNRLTRENSMNQNKIYNDIFSPSIQLAQVSCQKSFEWDQWNCPSEDFLSKRSLRSLDKESAFVTALITASVIYTITKNCSAGQLPGCGCLDISKNFICSDDTYFGETIADILFNDDIALDAQGYAVLHNNRASKIAVRNSMQKLCKCNNILSPNCEDQTCWTSLGTFESITKELRKMYDNAVIVEVNNKGLIDWHNIPQDVLTYVHDSPNYCQPNVIPKWKGTIGRLCSRPKGKSSFAEKRSCRNICRICGLKVYERKLLVEKRCNCKFSWCCDVRCDICTVIEKEYYCGY